MSYNWFREKNEHPEIKRASLYLYISLPASRMNPKIGQTFTYVMKNTLQKIKILKDLSKKTVCIWMEWPRSVQITRSLPPRRECSHSSLNWKALLSALTHHSYHLERKNRRCKSCWKSWNSQSDLFLLLLRYWLIVWRAQTNDFLHCVAGKCREVVPLLKCFPLPLWWEWRKTAWWLLNKKQDHLWVTDYMSDKPRREIV